MSTRKNKSDVWKHFTKVAGGGRCWVTADYCICCSTVGLINCTVSVSVNLDMWFIYYSFIYVLFRISDRLVKTVTGKPVNQFPTGYRFSECITGYQIYPTSQRHDPGNADSGVWQLPGPALRCRDCRRPPFSRNSSVVGSFWTSVLATGRLSTSVVHVCCPSTWTVLYFWMEISNWAGLVADFEHRW